MSYVDAIYDKKSDKVLVVERVDGKRIQRVFRPNYEFYYDDPNGRHKGIHGNPVSKAHAKTRSDFYNIQRKHSGKQLYESDINVVNKCLEENYKGKDSPKLHTVFFDIETDFHKEKGFSPPEDPFNKVTAVSLYLDWTKDLICLALPPNGMSDEEVAEITKKFDNTFMFSDEGEMLLTFLDLIEDADILSGWNSEGYDIPYLVNRIKEILPSEVNEKFCLWDNLPKVKKYERYGSEHETYALVGRVHLDYMQLYRKYTYQEMHSYALDAISEYELGEKKVAYTGTLDQLYNDDFEKFIDYARQDTMLLAKMDEKLKFIDLSNEIAHANTVSIPSTMGSVGITEQAIINEAHERGVVVPDRNREEENTQAAGAYVAYPKKGVHKWIGSVDINSLYPSVIRALNMAPETIIGQFRLDATDAYINSKMVDQRNAKGKMHKGSSFAGAWEGLFGSLEYTAVIEKTPDTQITVDWVSGEVTTHSTAELNDIIFNNDSGWALSANGTIFSLEVEGVIPGLLKRWYDERKIMQAKKREATTPEDKEFWDKRQLVKKIGLNSLYGAILNKHCRFFDKRIGQSTTLTGRAIAKHMDAFANECMTGEYDYDGECIIYGDTDSCYFSAWPVMEKAVEEGAEWDKEIATALYEEIADRLNVSFPLYMERGHNVPPNMGEIIKCGREITGLSGLFIKKKRYAIMVYDNEGTRYDSDGGLGKVKAMGLDLKRSDTPVIIQDFLKDILDSLLSNKDTDSIIAQIIKFKKEFKTKPSWEKGTPKRVNNITEYKKIIDTEIKKKEYLNEQLKKFNNDESKFEKDIPLPVSGKVKTVPGHVRAAINWNNLRKINKDNHSMEISDGMKTVVCKLKDNQFGYTSVGIPIDEHNIPKWYTDLPFDDALMETNLIDKKVENLLGVLDWDLINRTNINSTINDLFDFG